MPAPESGPTIPIVSADRVSSSMARALHLFCAVEREMTLAALADAAGIERERLYDLKEAKKRWRLDEALSVAAVMGPRFATIGFLGGIGMSASSAEADDTLCLPRRGARIIRNMGTLLEAAADNRIDHREAPGCEAAAAEIMEDLASFRRTS